MLFESKKCSDWSSKLNDVKFETEICYSKLNDENFETQRFKLSKKKCAESSKINRFEKSATWVQNKNICFKSEPRHFVTMEKVKDASSNFFNVTTII